MKFPLALFLLAFAIQGNCDSFSSYSAEREGAKLIHESGETAGLLQLIQIKWKSSTNGVRFNIASPPYTIIDSNGNVLRENDYHIFDKTYFWSVE